MRIAYQLPTIAIVRADAMASVVPYLLPYEKNIVTVRKHPVTLIPPVAVLFLDIAAIILDVTNVIRQNTPLLGALCAAFVLSSFYLYHCVRAWRAAFLIITAGRVILVKWRRNRSLSFTLLAQVEDFSLVRTLPGRIIGYGSLVFGVHDDGARSWKIRHIPYPEQLFLEVSALLISDRKRS